MEGGVQSSGLSSVYLEAVRCIIVVVVVVCRRASTVRYGFDGRTRLMRALVLVTVRQGGQYWGQPFGACSLHRCIIVVVVVGAVVGW